MKITLIVLCSCFLFLIGVFCGNSLNVLVIKNPQKQIIKDTSTEYKVGYAICDYVQSRRDFDTNNENNRLVILNAMEHSKIDFFKYIFGVYYRGEQEIFELQTGGHHYEFVLFMIDNKLQKIQL